MQDHEVLPLRDIVLGVSAKVDELTKLLHTHIERLVSQRDGMERLGKKTDDLEFKISKKTDDLEARIRDIELSAASSGTENKSTSEWVKMVLVIVITAVLTVGMSRLLVKDVHEENEKVRQNEKHSGDLDHVG